MAKFLIDTRGPSPSQPERLRGAVIAVLDDGHVPGRKETLENGFAWIDCPSVPRATVVERASALIFEAKLDILTNDPGADFSTTRIHNKNRCSIVAPTTGVGRHWNRILDITVDSWGFSNRVDGTEERTADMNGEDVAFSEAMWGGPPNEFLHLTDSYSPGTGIRRTTTMYAAHLTAVLGRSTARVMVKRGMTAPEAQAHITARVEARMETMGRPNTAGTLVDVNHQTRRVIMDFDRSMYQQQIQRDLTDRIDFQYAKRRHLFEEAVVAAAEAAGGTVQIADLTDLTDRATL